jgi:hypothetical protein
VTQIATDFSNFVIHKIVHRNGRYFCEISELATEDKFSDLRAREKLRVRDYTPPDLF